MTIADQPRIKANDWSVLRPARPGEWTPALSVSVVIPAFQAGCTLPYTLAALAAQTYPSDLLEVVVVDDGSTPPLELPELRPANTRVVRPQASWGRANACHTGAEAATGDVVHWLDADMVPCRDHVEAQMRWHHLLDHAVVLGHKTFVDPEDLPPVAEVADAVRDDRLDALFAGRWTSDHEWVEKIWRRSDDLTRSGFRAFHVHVGATASVPRAFYRASGGMDAGLKLGEDVELGYRMAVRGAVFVADREARSWHLGRSTLMEREQEVQRYNAPFIAERVPDLRKFRTTRGRSYRVPLVEVVVDTRDHTFEEVRYTVDGVLQGAPSDVHCLLVGPWGGLDDRRRHPLGDPMLDTRLVREEYAGEGRVSFVEAPPVSAFPALFRMHLPTGWRPGGCTVEDLVLEMQRRAQGLRSVLLPDGSVVRLERTTAFERARRVMRAGEDLDDVVDEVSATWWSEGVEDGFLHPIHAPVPSSAAAAPAAATPSGVESAGPAAGPVAGAGWARRAARRAGLGRLRRHLRR